MIDSVARLMAVDPGFNSKIALVMDITTAQKNLYYGPPVDARSCDDLQEQAGPIPGVVSIGAVSHLPLQGQAGRGITIEGESDPGPENQAGAGYSIACPNYFKTTGIPIVEGREFTEHDALDAPGVVVIDESMARRDWP